MQPIKKDDKNRKGFNTSNPFLFILDALDTPSNAVRVGAKAIIDGEDDVLKKTLKGLTRQEVVYGTDINDSLGLTDQNTNKLVRGALGLGTEMVSGLPTARLEAAAIGGAFKGLGKVGKTVAKSDTAKKIATKMVGEETLQRLGKARKVKNARKKFEAMGHEMTRDGQVLTKGVLDKNKKMREMRESLFGYSKLAPDDRKIIDRGIIDYINTRSKYNESRFHTASSVLDNFIDTMRSKATKAGKMKTNVSKPDFRKLDRSKIYNFGLKFDGTHLDESNVEAMENTVRTLNNYFERAYGIHMDGNNGLFNLRAVMDKDTGLVKHYKLEVSEQAGRRFFKNAEALEDMDFRRGALENSLDLASRLSGQPGMRSEILKAFDDIAASTAATELGLRQGAIYDEIFEVIYNMPTKQYDKYANSKKYKKLFKNPAIKRLREAAEEVVAAPHREQFFNNIDAFARNIHHTDDDIAKAFKRGFNTAPQSMGHFDNMAARFAAVNPSRLSEFRQFMNDTVGLYDEATQLQGNMHKFYGNSGYGNLKGQNILDSKVMPTFYNFRNPAIKTMAAKFNLPEEIFHNLFEDNFKLLPKEGMTKQLLDAGVPPQQVQEITEYLDMNRNQFNKFSGDRGTSKRVNESLIEKDIRTQEAHNAALAKIANGVDASLGPEVITDINEIVEGRVREVALNGVEERIGIEMLKDKSLAQYVPDVTTAQIPEGYEIINLDSFPMQNRKSVLYRSHILQTLGLDPNTPAAHFMVREDIAAYLKNLHEGAHFNNMLGLNKLTDQKFLEDVSKSSKQLLFQNVTDAVLSATDKVLNQVRKFVIFTPGYHIRNVTGQHINMYLAGMDPDAIANYYGKHIGNWLDIWKNGKKNDDVIRHLVQDPKYRYYIEHFDRSPLSVQYDWENAPQNVMDLLKDRVLKEHPEIASNPGKLNNVLNRNLELTVATDHASRMATFDYYVDKNIASGLPPQQAYDEALKQASKVVFSRLDLGPQGNKVLKNMFLFSGWTINNTKFHLSNMAKNSPRYAMMYKAMQGMHHNLGNPETLSDWQIERGRFALPLGNNQDMIFKIDNPAYVGPGTLLNPFKTGAGALSPIIKLPIEMGTGRDLFFGREIKSYPRQVLESGLGLRNVLTPIDTAVTNSPLRQPIQNAPDPISNFFDTSERKEIHSIWDFFNQIPGFPTQTKKRP